MLTRNSKMKKTKDFMIWNWTIPALRCPDTGVMTCPMAGACAKFCYAQKGAYPWPNVRQAHTNNLQLAMSDDFVELMSTTIEAKKRAAYKKNLPLAIRIHDAGDFFSPQYLSKWIEIMKRHDDVVFYAYTKSHRLVQRMGVPHNFIVIKSEGGKDDRNIKPGDRHARIFPDIDSLVAAGYDNASDDDSIAFKSTTGKIGLVAH